MTSGRLCSRRDLTDDYAALTAHNLPAVSFLKAST